MKPEKVFKAHSNLKLYFETSDGVKFFTKNTAENHAKTLENRFVKEVKRTSFKKSDIDGAGAKNKNEGEKTNGTPAQGAKKRKEAIIKLETVVEVEKALESETAASVKTAGAERIEELKEASKKNTDTTK